MLTVNWAGKEKRFAHINHAIAFMKVLDDSSDLWSGEGLDLRLVRTRFKTANGWEVTTYHAGTEHTYVEKNEVLVLGKEMVRIEINNEEGRNRVCPPFTVLGGGFPK